MRACERAVSKLAAASRSNGTVRMSRRGRRPHSHDRRSCRPGGLKPDRFAQPAAHAVALDRIADLFRDGKADARPVRRRRVRSTSIRKSGPRRFRPSRTARNSARFFKRRSSMVRCPGRQRANARSGATAACGRGATGCDDLAAALGGHAGAETVTALADELARVDRSASFVSIPRSAALLGSVTMQQERFGQFGRNKTLRRTACPSVRGL